MGTVAVPGILDFDLIRQQIGDDAKTMGNAFHGIMMTSHVCKADPQQSRKIIARRLLTTIQVAAMLSGEMYGVIQAREATLLSAAEYMAEGFR